LWISDPVQLPWVLVFVYFSQALVVARTIVFSFNSFLKKIFMPEFLCDLITIPNMNPMVGVVSHGAEPRGLDGMVGRRGADVAKA
jgi:hypothetical protein